MLSRLQPVPTRGKIQPASLGGRAVRAKHATVARLAALGWLLTATIWGTPPPEGPAAQPRLVSAEEGTSQGAAKRASQPLNQFPAAVLQLPPNTKTAITVDLENNKLHLLRAGQQGLEIVASFYVSIGKAGAAKKVEGDEKTPVGIYFIVAHIPGDELPEIYGAGALPLNYPNSLDQRREHSGSGIWIHGTDKTTEELLPQSSRGCLTLRNKDFLRLSQEVEISHTPVVISRTLRWLPASDLDPLRHSLAATLESWRHDWESRATERYLSHYAEDFRSGSMSRRRFAAHKKRVNASKNFIEVSLEEIGFYLDPAEKGLALVTFEQNYRSNNFEQQRLKHQYWRRQDGSWKIVLEGGV